MAQILTGAARWIQSMAPLGVILALMLSAHRPASAAPRPPVNPLCVKSFQSIGLTGFLNNGPQSPTKARLRNLYETQETFRDFFDRFTRKQVEAEQATQVLQWLKSGIPRNDKQLRKQMSDLERDTESRVFVKKQKLVLIFEILSFAKQTDNFKAGSFFFQSMAFNAPKDIGIPDPNAYHIVELLEFALRHMKENKLGVDELLEDPAMIEQIRNVNRKFDPQDVSGRSGIF